MRGNSLVVVTIVNCGNLGFWKINLVITENKFLNRCLGLVVVVVVVVVAVVVVILVVVVVVE